MSKYLFAACVFAFAFLCETAIAEAGGRVGVNPAPIGGSSSEPVRFERPPPKSPSYGTATDHAPSPQTSGDGKADEVVMPDGRVYEWNDTNQRYENGSDWVVFHGDNGDGSPDGDYEWKHGTTTESGRFHSGP